MSERMTAERLAKIRTAIAGSWDTPHMSQEILAELDAVTRERDEWEKRANYMADHRDTMRRERDEAREVTDEMVTAAGAVMYPGHSATLDHLRDESRDMIRNMLSRALRAASTAEAP